MSTEKMLHAGAHGCPEGKCPECRGGTAVQPENVEPPRLYDILRSHSPIDTARTDGYPQATGIACKCDGVWRGPAIYAQHVAASLTDAGYERSEL